MIFGPWPGFGPSIAGGRHHPSLGHEPQASWVVKMFSVIFEVHPKEEQFDLDLALTKDVKPILEGIDGFIDNERFESARRPGWSLSHSTWRDEKSVVRWRTVAKHHETQQRGRDEVFQDYHLRVGEIVLATAPPRGHTDRGATEPRDEISCPSSGSDSDFLRVTSKRRALMPRTRVRLSQARPAAHQIL